MNCPHCQKELPANYSANWCSFCGKDLPEPASSEQELPPVKFKWKLFLCVLLAPPLLTLLSAAAMHFLILPDSTNESLTPFVGLIGGGIGGIICGVLIGLQSRNLAARVFLSIFMAAIMIPVCVTLCIFGCTFGGYDFRID